MEEKKMGYFSPRKKRQDKSLRNARLQNQEGNGISYKRTFYPLERILWLLMISSWAISQIVFDTTKNKYPLLLTVGFALLFILILLYHSLFPLRISISRITYVIIALLVIWLSVHPAFY